MVVVLLELVGGTELQVEWFGVVEYLYDYFWWKLP